MSLRQNAPNIERWSFFSIGNRNDPSSAKTTLHRATANHMVEGNFTAIRKRTMDTEIPGKMVKQNNK